MSSPPDGQRLSRRMQGLRSSAIRDLLHEVGKRDMISLAGGLPAPELFPIELLLQLLPELLRSSDGPEALQYGATEGVPALRRFLAGRAPFPAGTFQEGDVIVTEGSQQGLDLACKVFLDPGDEVLVETPAYVGALQALRLAGARVTFLPCDGEGVDPEALRRALRPRPKLLYLTPTFQNPSGLCYPEGRRREVAAALNEGDTVLLEDDPYRELWYEAPPPPPVGAGVDPERRLYLGTSSKTVAPGLRIGWLLGSASLARRFALAKQPTDLCTGALSQHVALRLMGHPTFEAHLARLRDAYRRRRDALEAALGSELGDRVRWRRPLGGIFLWARLDPARDAAVLLSRALREGVVFVPGAEFHAEGEGVDTLRLNFSNASEHELREGVARLARALAGWHPGS